jgi:pimeloyl-ACP methyl ester carboxylesterase
MVRATLVTKLRVSLAPMAIRFVEVGVVRLRVAVDGAAEAPVLALINGALTNLLVWTPVLERFGERFRVVRHDVRGNGGSSGGLNPPGFSRASGKDGAIQVAASRPGLWPSGIGGFDPSHPATTTRPTNHTAPTRHCAPRPHRITSVR